VGPRARRDHVQAGGPRLSEAPLELDGGEPRLVAARCVDCGALAFPPRPSCPACGGAVERVPLPRRGTLWTWTTQGFEPPSPPYVRDGEGEFAPYAVGYVELPGALRVEGRLTEASPGRLRIGMAMEVVAVERAGGRTFAFAPVEEGPE
jgi:uncharacterized OB-fold protein